MANSRYISRQHLVMATEPTPGRFRPGNQLNLEPAKASNPFTTSTDGSSFMPGMGECRSGNGCSDLGLGGRWLGRRQKVKRLPRRKPLNGLGDIASTSPLVKVLALAAAFFAVKSVIKAKNAR